MNQQPSSNAPKPPRTPPTKPARLHVALLNPRKPNKEFPYVGPESFRCKPATADKRPHIYHQEIAGCTVSVDFWPGKALIDLDSLSRTIGAATLVWHKVAAEAAWSQITSTYRDSSTRLPRFIARKWRRPARLPWLAISLDPDFVKNDRSRNEISMASALFTCISQGLLQHVLRHADPDTGVMPHCADLSSDPWFANSPR